MVLTSSTKILDITGDKQKELKGIVPKRSVVILEAIPRISAGNYRGTMTT